MIFHVVYRQGNLSLEQDKIQTDLSAHSFKAHIYIVVLKGQINRILIVYPPPCVRACVCVCVFVCVRVSTGTITYSILHRAVMCLNVYYPKHIKNTDLYGWKFGVLRQVSC